MGGSSQTKGSGSSVEAVEKARQGIEEMEAGGAAGLNKIKQAENVDPASVEAAEQEAADGPPGRGLSR